MCVLETQLAAANGRSSFRPASRKCELRFLGHLLIWLWVKTYYTTYYCHILGNNHQLTSYVKVPKVPGL